MEAEFRALIEPPVGLGRGAQAPGKPDLAEGRRARLDRRAPRRGCDRERNREVGARLVDADTAGDVDEDVGCTESDACVAQRTATIIASRFGSTPVATRRGIARSLGATSAWISSRIGRVPSSAQATAAPTSPSAPRPNSSEGSGTPTSPVPVISKTPSSFVEPKRFFVARRTRCAW